MSALYPARKTELRARLRRVRRDLARSMPDAAWRAAERLPLDRIPAFAVVGGYHALGSELDPSPLLRRLVAEGARLALPMAARRDMPLTFRAWRAQDEMEPDALGVPAPPAAAPLLAPDLVIAPLLAFDRRGGRLGQGGGYYDRSLANLRAAKPVFVVGLGFSGQELDHVPAEAHDQRLDAVLTEAEFIMVGDQTP